jgi:hypothetical protein
VHGCRGKKDNNNNIFLKARELLRILGFAKLRGAFVTWRIVECPRGKDVFFRGSSDARRRRRPGVDLAGAEQRAANITNAR